MKIAFRFRKQGSVIPPDPEEPDFDTLNVYENQFDTVYYGKNGLNSSGIQATQGQPIYTIPDKKGSLNMTFTGDETPVVIGTPPKLFDKGIRAENVPDLQYTSNTFATKSFPYEMWLVMISRPCQAYEAYENNFNSDNYYGNNGGSSRVGENNLNIPGSGINPLFKVSLARMQYNASTCKLWIDGVLQGSGTRSPSRSSRKIINSIFTNTNNVSWDFLAGYHKYSIFSDADALAITNSLISKWNIGQEVQTPYAYNIQESFNSVTQSWSVSFSSKNLSGTGIDSGATQYRWYLNRRASGAPNGNFSDQVLVGSSATLSKSSYTSYLSGFVGTYYLKCYIQVQDSTGKTFGFNSSPGYADE